MSGRSSRLTALLLLGTLAGGGCGANGASPGTPGVVRPMPVVTEADRSTTRTDEGGTMSDQAGTTLPTALSAPARRSRTGEPLEVRLVARNATDRTLELLLWNTPFERTLSADLFAVTRDGEPLPYRGRLVKRAMPPAATDFARLAPGEAIERTVDLASSYDVDRPGTYVIRFTPGPTAADGGPVRLVAGGTGGGANDGGDEVVVERY